MTPIDINRNAILGARKLIEKETVINKLPTKPTVLQPNFFSTGGRNGPTMNIRFHTLQRVLQTGGSGMILPKDYFLLSPHASIFILFPIYDFLS